MKLDGSVNENMLSRGTTPVKLIKITTLTSNGYIYRFFFFFLPLRIWQTLKLKLRSNQVYYLILRIAKTSLTFCIDPWKPLISAQYSYTGPGYTYYFQKNMYAHQLIKHWTTNKQFIFSFMVKLSKLLRGFFFYLGGKAVV